MEIVGWIVWGIVCLVGVIQLVLSGHKDGGIRILARRVAFLIFLGLFLTLFFNLSKLHLIWWVLISFILPMWYFKWNVKHKVSDHLTKIEKGENHLLPEFPKIKTLMSQEEKQAFISLLAIVPEIKRTNLDMDRYTILKYAEMIGADMDNLNYVNDEDDTLLNCVDKLKGIGWIERRLLIRCIAGLVYLDNPPNKDASNYVMSLSNKLGISTDEFKSIIEQESLNYSRNLSITESFLRNK